MKRSELKRKTPLKRSTKSPKPTVHRYWRDAREKVEREAAERLMGAIYWTLRTPGHKPYDFALQAARENMSEVLEALFSPSERSSE